MTQQFSPLEQDPQISFRTARLEDLEAVRELLRHLGYAMRPSLAYRSLAAVLADPCAHVVVAASAADAVIGLMTLRLFPVLHLGGCQLSIDEMVVAPAHRGRGIGRELLRYAFSYAQLKGAVRLEVLTNSYRASARRGFYPNNGFQRAACSVYRIQP